MRDDEAAQITSYDGVMGNLKEGDRIYFYDPNVKWYVRLFRWIFNIKPKKHIFTVTKNNGTSVTIYPKK